ncbi:MAG: DUF4136 domain-containing protein [Alphaproteobacteria bacterium]
MTTSKIGIIAIALVLSACAQSIKSDVTRFHRLEAPQGAAVAIVAPDQRKQGSLEFERASSLLMGHLARHGFVPAGETPPVYIAHLDYGQSPVGDFDDRPSSSLSIGVSGGSGGYHGGGVGVGFGTSFPVGEPRGGSASREVTLEIDRVDTGERVFEGRARSIGPARNFEGALPYMIDALFEDFPGQSGTTVTVERQVE